MSKILNVIGYSICNSVYIFNGAQITTALRGTNSSRQEIQFAVMNN